MLPVAQPGPLLLGRWPIVHLLFAAARRSTSWCRARFVAPRRCRVMGHAIIVAPGELPRSPRPPVSETGPAPETGRAGHRSATGVGLTSADESPRQADVNISAAQAMELKRSRRRLAPQLAEAIGVAQLDTNLL